MNSTSLVAAESVIGAIESAVDEMEAGGRMPSALASSIADAGLFRMLVPKSLGGGEVHPLELVDVVERIARVNASAAWCVMIAATTGVMAGWMPRDRAAEVFGDRSGVWGGAYAPLGCAVVDGDDFVLDGRWPWGSGSQNCTWFAGGATCDDGVFRLCYVPASEVTIHENWDVVGLRGTGSHDWSVVAARVPRDRTVALLGGVPVDEGTLYRFPVFGLLALGISAVALGIGAAAIDELIGLAGAKTPSLQRRRLADRGTVQAEVARMTAELRGARAYLVDAVNAAWASIADGGDPDVATRAELRLAATHAAHTVTRVVDSAFTLAGGTSVRTSSPLARHLRDCHVVTQHLMVSPVTYETVGRVLLGLPNEAMDL